LVVDTFRKSQFLSKKIKRDEMIIIRSALLLLVLAQSGWPQGIIRLKTRNFSPAATPAAARPGRFPTNGRRHYLILFRSYPGPDVLAELARRRIQVLGYVPENTLMVSAAMLNLQGLDVSWAGPMDPADKISPVLATQPTGAYLVIFQPDTDIAQDRELAQNLGFSVIENSSLLAGQLMVSGAYSGLSSLAALDQVAYILPASLQLQDGDAVAGCAGALTPAGPVAQYVQMGGGWSKDANGGVALRYFLDSITPKLNESLVRSEIARAFAEWARYSNLTITPASEPNMARSIDILFARFAHGDAYPFDGPGGALAHTFYPAPGNSEPVAGDMHLDADETWRVGSTVDLYSVVLHETGHSLGLGHSDNPSSVMYPYYRQQTVLTSDDIAGLQALYGKSPVVSPPPTGGGGSPGTGSTGSGQGSGTGTGTPPAPDTVAPTLTILSPSSSIVSAYTATISISGIAGDNVAVAAVKWTTSTGNAGDAIGTTTWSAAVPLLVGDNVVTIRAYDAAGNSTWRVITVVRH
jgi:Matrixin/Glucodextranase, domain B